MTLWYAVGIKIGNKADQMTVEAEDALIAALKVKTAHSEAVITYVRKRSARGDRRHPHSSQIDENPAERAAGRTAQSRTSVQTVRGTIAETMPDPHTQASGPEPQPEWYAREGAGVGRAAGKSCSVVAVYTLVSESAPPRTSRRATRHAKPSA